MLLNSVILVLQETLEIVMLVSVLLVISFRLKRGVTWLPYGLTAGIIFASLYAVNMAHISEWFGYVGQEVVNALLHLTIVISCLLLTWTLTETRDIRKENENRGQGRNASIYSFCAISIVTLGITREGSEIMLYMSAFFPYGDNLQSVLIGSAIGFSIGISISILLFYGLLGLRGNRGMQFSIILLALFTGNMLSQSTLQLIQADWISSSSSLWNTSYWLPEDSIPGQLLYALIGYEASPSLVQAASYAAGFTLVLVIAAFGKYRAQYGLQQKRIKPA